MPVFNEAPYITRILERVQASPVVKEIIVVDDASTDGTRDILRGLMDKPELKLIFHEFNQGKGAAIRTGIQFATAALTIIQDADLEYNPSDYDRLIAPLLSDQADVVYGSRYLGEKKDPVFFAHTAANKVLTFLSNFCTGLKLTDMETCYKVFKTDLIKKVPLRSNRFGFEPEITAKVGKLKWRLIEVPVSYRGRSYAEGKKIGWKDGISTIYTIFKFWILDDIQPPAVK